MREFHIKAILGKVADLSDSSVPSSFFFLLGLLPAGCLSLPRLTRQSTQELQAEVWCFVAVHLPFYNNDLCRRGNRPASTSGQLQLPTIVIDDRSPAKVNVAQTVGRLAVWLGTASMYRIAYKFLLIYIPKRSLAWLASLSNILLTPSKSDYRRSRLTDPTSEDRFIASQ